MSHSVNGGDKAETVEVVLEDINCGGMAVIDLRSTINFEVGTRYRNCLIGLPEVGGAKVDIRIKHISEASHGTTRFSAPDANISTRWTACCP